MKNCTIPRPFYLGNGVLGRSIHYFIYSIYMVANCKLYRNTIKIFGDVEFC